MSGLMAQIMPQTGIGIELRGGSLHAFCARSFWGKMRVTDTLEIEDYRAAGAAECGRRYREFLRRNGLKAPWTVVALPRSEVLLRPLRFPAAMKRELTRAVELQLDSLHPFEAGAVVWDVAPVAPPEPSPWLSLQQAKAENAGAPIDVVVAIAEKNSVAELAAWFQEAVIPVSQFAVSSTLLLAAFREVLRPELAAGGTLFVLHMREDGCELIASAPGRPLLSREIAGADGTQSEEERLAHWGRELESARSELRLQPGEQASLVLCGASVIPESAIRDAGLPFRVVSAQSLLPLAGRISDADSLGVAAAVAAAQRGPSLPLNLLPAERRSYQSPFTYTPTYALAGLVIILAVALGMRGVLQDVLYSRYLEREQESLRPQIEELERLQGESRQTYERLATLAGFRQSAGLPVELLDELTRTLPADAWLQQIQYDGAAVTLSGTAQSASAVLQALAASSYLESPQFSASLTRTPEGKEVFRIGARLRVPAP